MEKREWLRRLLGLALGAGMAAGLIQWTAAPAQAQSRRGFDPAQHDVALEGKPAPEFTLSDNYGMPHRLSGWRGMPIFLHFGASW